MNRQAALSPGLERELDRGSGRRPAEPPPEPLVHVPGGFDPDEPLEVPAQCARRWTCLRTTQQYALQDLMDGASYTDAAQRAGVSRKTLYRYGPRVVGE